MARYMEIVRAREKEIARLIDFLSEKSKVFKEPKLILIGGYALRVFVPYSRFTRDCDFCLRKKDGWHLDELKKWFTKDTRIEAFEERENSGFMRCIKLIKVEKRLVRASLDFMEGEVTGRAYRDIVRIDEKFEAGSRKVKIRVADKEFEVYVPSYTDYFILKVVSARISDTKDVATMIWKRGVPKRVRRRVNEVMPYPQVFEEKIRKSISPIISDRRFLHSWRGTFATTEFSEEVRDAVMERLEKFVQ